MTARWVGSGLRPATARELQTILEAERAGAPFFVYRDFGGELRITRFEREQNQLTVGRSAAADFSITWDDQVSGLHAVLQRLAGELALVDDGLSRNGSYVNGRRIRGMCRLRERDIVRIGTTLVLVRQPSEVSRNVTTESLEPFVVPALSTQQRKVLSVLCRPPVDATAFTTPPTNEEIASELHLSVPAVKGHLRALFAKFALGQLPHNKKRAALIRRALQSGLLSDHELAPGV
jgi:pSer/pThr/pTyr-binding forkhead associated (FHA) protein